MCLNVVLVGRRDLRAGGTRGWCVPIPAHLLDKHKFGPTLHDPPVSDTSGSDVTAGH